MDATPPSAAPGSPLYHYSSDLGTTGYPGGALINPTSLSTTPSASDCSGGNWANNLINVQSHFWVASPLTASTTLTGDGALTMFSQTAGGVPAVVSFCIEIYDVPPSGAATTLTDIFAWPPVVVGGAAYVGATDPSTGGNWPTAASQLSFVFNYSQQPVTIAAGHRVGVRIWFKENSNTAIDLIYDNPNYAAQLQLNSQ